jgi:hypothetical protein
VLGELLPLLKDLAPDTLHKLALELRVDGRLTTSRLSAALADSQDARLVYDTAWSTWMPALMKMQLGDFYAARPKTRRRPYSAGNQSGRLQRNAGLRR